MEIATALVRYGHALGRWQAAWRFASPELRRAVGLAQISAAWDVFRRDAGPGDVGPAHEPSIASTSLLSTGDPRRDGLLLWLADHAAPAVAEAAGLLARAVGANRRLGADDRDLLEAARDALAAPTSARGPVARILQEAVGPDSAVGEGLLGLAGVVDRLRRDPAFLEGGGNETRHTLPGGALRHFVPATPGAAWALNLALLSRAAGPLGLPAYPGLISRALFRDAEPEDLAVALVGGAAAALEAGYALCARIEPELVRGTAALTGLSRNARARTAWLLVVALGGISRSQLARALGLSRAGADIQAHALADAGLVMLWPAGRIEWVQNRQPRGASAKAIQSDELTGAFADFDASMAEVDRLLTQTVRGAAPSCGDPAVS